MKHNHLVRVACLVVAMLLLHAAATAQTGQLRGRVLFKNSDGTTAPVAEAMIDVFRMDLRGEFHTKTRSDGEFAFAGLPLPGTYLIAASSPNADPQVLANVKVGRDVEYELVLDPGEGKRLTREEAQVTPPQPPKVETVDALIERKFREGNQAIHSRNYDQAITSYDEALAVASARPEAMVALLSNKSFALLNRGVQKYNDAPKLGVTKQSATTDQGFRDFRESAEAASRAVEIINAQAVGRNEVERASQKTNKYFALHARADAMRLLVSLVDPSQAAAGLAAFQEYIDAEDDPVKKSSAELKAGNMLLQAKQTKLASEVYRRILVSDPKNPEAVFGYGMSLYQSGERNRFPEAAVYLQAFVDQAFAEDPLRQIAAEALNKIKAPE